MRSSAHRMLAMILVMAAVALSAPASAADKMRVGKAVAEAFSFVPPDVGMRNGIFQKNNTELELIAFAGDARMQQAAAADSIDILLGSGPAMAFIAKGAPIKGVAGRRRSRTRSRFGRSRSWPPHCVGARRVGGCRLRRSSPTAPTATTLPSAPGCRRSSSSTCSPSQLRSASTGRKRPSRYRSGTERSAGAGRSLAPTASRSRCGRSPSGYLGAPGRRSPVAQQRRVTTSPAASRSSVSSPPIRSAPTADRRARSG